MFKNKTVEEKKAFKNKVAWGVVGVAGVVGVFALGVTIGKHNGSITNTNSIDKTIMALKVVDNSTNTINNINSLVRRGHPGIVIFVNETGETFASINRAAKVLGTTATSIRKHLKGEIESVNGFTLTSLGDMPNT